MAQNKLVPYSNLLVIYALVFLSWLLSLLLIIQRVVHRALEFGVRVARSVSNRAERMREYVKRADARLQAQTLDRLLRNGRMFYISGNFVLEVYDQLGLLSWQTELLHKRIRRGKKGAVVELAELQIKHGDLRSAMPLLKQVCAQWAMLTTAQLVATAGLLLQILLVRDGLQLDLVGRNVANRRSCAEIDRMIGSFDVAGTGIMLCDLVLAKGSNSNALEIKMNLLFRSRKYQEVVDLLTKESRKGRMEGIQFYVRWADALERTDSNEDAIAVRKQGLEAYGAAFPPFEVVRLAELELRADKLGEGASHLSSVLRRMQYGMFD